MLERKIKSFNTILPMAIGLFVLITWFNQMYYYSLFRVNISHYSSFFEYPMLFFNGSISKMFMLGMVLLYVFYLGIKEQYNYSYTNKEFKKDVILTLAAVALILVPLFIPKYPLLLKQMWASLASVLLIHNAYDIYLKKGYSGNYLLYVAFLLTVYLSINSKYQSIIVKTSNYQPVNMCIEFEDKTVNLDSNTKLIGKTTDYLFIYQRNTKEVMVMPNSSIKSIIIKEN